VFLMFDVFLMFADDNPTHLTAKGSLWIICIREFVCRDFPYMFSFANMHWQKCTAPDWRRPATQESELRAMPTGCYGYE
jgi:hypothetical protein